MSLILVFSPIHLHNLRGSPLTSAVEMAVDVVSKMSIGLPLGGEKALPLGGEEASVSDMANRFCLRGIRNSTADKEDTVLCYVRMRARASNALR